MQIASALDEEKRLNARTNKMKADKNIVLPDGKCVFKFFLCLYGKFNYAQM